MMKQFKLVAALVIAGLATFSFGETVDAAANAGDANVGKENNRDEYKGNFSDFEAFYNQCLLKWNIKWDEKTTDTEQDKPKTEQPKVEKPEEKAPEQTVEQPTEPKQNEQATEPNNVEQQPQQNTNQEASALNQFEQQVFDLTNKERVKNGLPALQVDQALSKVAREKSRDMAVNQYFDHNSPTYGSPFDMMQAYGIKYRAAGENIAKGQQTPEEVVNAWMNSEGHRANILNGSFTHIGVGYVEQGNHWTQQFIGK